MRRFISLLVALVAAAVLVSGAVALAQTTTTLPPPPPPCVIPPGGAHFYAHTHTNFGGYASVDIPSGCILPATAVVKVASGATHLGGEDPSFATANFAGFVDGNTIRVRVIGWHANLVTGAADFRYYSDKDVDLAVDLYLASPPVGS